MDVTIIGAGNMGRGIGTRLVAGGNRVKILDNDPGQARELAESSREAARPTPGRPAIRLSVTWWSWPSGTRTA